MSQSKYIISLAFVTLLLISLAFAAPSITNPVEGTVWNAGQTVTITWINPDTTGPTKVTIVLRKGNPSALSDVATIASDVAVDQKQVTYKIPTTIVSGGDYTVGIGVEPSLNYSHQFTISGGTGSSSGSPSGTSSGTSGTSTATSSNSNSASFLTPAATTATARPSTTEGASAKTSSSPSPKSTSPPATAAGNSSPSSPTNAASRAHSGYTIPGLVALLSGFFFF